MDLLSLITLQEHKRCIFKCNKCIYCLTEIFRFYIMTKLYSSIPTVPLTNNLSFSHPPRPPEVAHLEDPAIDVMTDFKINHAITIKPEAPLNAAAIEMETCNIHMLLVTDKENKMIGMITTEDLLGEKPLTVAMTRQIKRNEVLVRMVMVPRENIVAFDIKDLKYAKLGNIVQTLHESKQHYALVLENNPVSNEQEIRGIFSLWDLSRRVGENLTYDVSEAHSLAELQRHLDGTN